MQRQFWHSLLAVLLGNAIYFSALGYLPPRARHQPFRIDWGLAVDFWVCLVCYGALGMTKWFRARRKSTK